MNRCLLVLVVGLTLTLADVDAEPNKNYPKIDDTCYVETNGDRVIRLAVEVAASPEEVWRTLTTSEGWKSFAVAFAQVDMRIGGMIETSYNPMARLGDPDNIKNEVVAYVPGRIMAIRCVQAPRDFKHKQEFFSTGTLFEIVPVEKSRTKIIVTAVGYKQGEAFDDLFKKFRWGDAYTLDKLRLLFEKGAPGPSSDNKDVQEFNRQPKTEK
ncbi:MAG TPA: SRPBCC domain-containing protein [Candidatus Dormibacteraeota bacterium]|nr:SRPBCC domain-containing protein [Candidatus Dormibacteraeota bacterium]